ncbi:MAG: hypothetical protein ABI416_16685 [Ginsengibacter sp.]
MLTSWILVITGAAAILGSIPLFIAASKNTHKALNFSSNDQPIPSLVKNMIGNRFIPSIRLPLNL